MLLQAIPNLRHLVEPLLGQEYAPYDCWQLLRDLLKTGWEIDCTEPGMLASKFVEVWFRGDPRPVFSLVQPWDCLVISRTGLVGDHCGLVLDDVSLVHAQRKTGVAIEPLRRWQRLVLQVVRLRQLA